MATESIISELSLSSLPPFWFDASTSDSHEMDELSSDFLAISSDLPPQEFPLRAIGRHRLPMGALVQEASSLTTLHESATAHVSCEAHEMWRGGRRGTSGGGGVGEGGGLAAALAASVEERREELATRM
mmetsp:Transcript_927/g.2919  ORF Transcript_927/g.2919 Transcript_927/m.2919 type:complete len:129 (-) Transcript_927:3456-3842(-)